MTLSREQRAAYPPNWADLSDWVRFVRAGGRCECVGGDTCGSPGHTADGRCDKRHGQPIPGNANGSPVVLTTAHLDQDITHNCPDNLAALCQGCHLSYDRKWRAEHPPPLRSDRVFDALGIPRGTVPVTVEFRWTGAAWQARLMCDDGQPATGWRTVNDDPDR